MKRSRAFITGVLAVVFSGATTFLALTFTILGATFLGDPAGIYSAHLILTIASFIVLVFSVPQVVVGSKLILKSKAADVKTKELNGLLVSIIVFVAFWGSIITLIFAILTLCTTDEAAGSHNETTENIPLKHGTLAEATGNPILQHQTPTGDIMVAVAKLKQSNEDGLISNAEYKQKVNDLVKEHILDN